MALANAQAPQTTFRSEIDLVQIPVRVLDARGEFVRGLTQSDFQILEDGEPQTVAAFNAVDIPLIETSAGSVPDSPLAVGDVVASNDSIDVDGRVYVFVIDNQMMRPDIALRTRHILRGFIREQLKANDIAAVVYTGIGRGQYFTRNRRLLNDAIEHVAGDPDPTDDAARRSMATITETALAMRSIKGRRKALVLISPTIICSLMAMDFTSSCREDARYALRAATQSDVSIYTLDPSGLNTSLRSRAEHANPNSTFRDGGYIEAQSGGAARAAFGAVRSEARGPDDAARYLAEESGGFAVVNTNNLDDGFSRLVRENSSYYLLGYYPVNARADGRARRNEVTVSRAGVRAVYRTSYLAPSPQGARLPSANNAPAVAATSVEKQLQELADNPLAVSTMPLRVAAAPFASDRRRASVSVVVEIPRFHLSPGNDATAPSAIKLSIGFYDRDGKAVSREEPTVDASGGTGDIVRFVSRLPVRAGVYRLWVGGVQIPTGVRGSVVTDIEVPDFSRSRFALSGITVLRGEQPVANRVFSSAEDVLLTGEIYDRRADGGTVSARLHIASRDGRSVYEADVTPSGSPLTYRAVLPLHQLGPGMYLATFEAASARPKRVSARRTLGFTVQ